MRKRNTLFVQGEWRGFHTHDSVIRDLLRFDDIESPIADTFANRLMFNVLFMHEPKQGSYEGIETL